MQTIRVHTARPYDILVGRELLDRAGEWARQVNRGSRALIVTDSHVAPLYAGRVRRSFETAGYAADVFTFPAGEEHKRLDVIAAIYTKLAQMGATRQDLLVALGGGVTGDMTGFAAATWLRGMDFVQIPTTLLAQVDASVGGKTGVDIDEGKNLVGAFWQPARVIADVDTLSTLPDGVFADGMAEVIKTACIKDADLFDRLEKGVDRGEMDAVIARCMDIKRGVVERDEKEAGERKLLNFGHTVGHALEKYYDYTGLTHGRAVAVGMVIVTRAAQRRGLTAPGTAGRIAAVLERYGLPTADPAGMSDWLPGVANDKKRAGKDIDLALLRGVGDSFVYRLPLAELGGFLRGEEI
ncbi:MAG: 3-dehydroquinate synthase [Acutalibacteraceae bacterium]|jgi:3-dehydroquinate synthase